MLMVLTGVKKLLGCIKGLSEEAKCNLFWKFIASATDFIVNDICCHFPAYIIIQNQQATWKMRIIQDLNMARAQLWERYRRLFE